MSLPGTCILDPVLGIRLPCDLDGIMKAAHLNPLGAPKGRMKPDMNTTSTERGQEMLAGMQVEMRRVVLGEMRTAGQLAPLAVPTRSSKISISGQPMADTFGPPRGRRILHPVRAESGRGIPALSGRRRRGPDFEPDPHRENSLGLPSCFWGLNSFLDGQRSADILASGPEWVIDAAQDEVNESKYPQG